MPKTDKVEATPKSADETVAPTETPSKPFNSEVRELAETISEDNLVGTQTEEDGEPSEPLTDPSPDETAEDTEPLDEGEPSDEDSEEAEEGGSELDEFLKESDDDEDVTTEEHVEKKSGLEKRIDKLTATNYELKAELERLKASEKPADITVDTKPKYTKEQLAKALEKAREDGDTTLELEIIEHMTESKAAEVEARYKAKEEAVKSAQLKQQKEWIAITDMFHYDEFEIYPGSQADLNIKRNDSLIYRLASELYGNHGYKDKENGMTQAVSKALSLILEKKRKSAKPQKSSNEKQLESKVKKLKRKTSSPSGSKTVKADPVKKDSRPKSDIDKVNDAVEERKRLTAWKQ